MLVSFPPRHHQPPHLILTQHGIRSNHASVSLSFLYSITLHAFQSSSSAHLLLLSRFLLLTLNWSISLDNSEYMRNGDYLPTRWEAQSDAVNIVFNSKTGSNPENNVGVMTMASKTPKVLVTLTQDIGKILSALHDSTIEGNSNIATGVNIAQVSRSEV